ncbi:MAG: hypothetical protein KJ831_10920, partial [Candidatus Eisenbacteria bacterium]|nr:hypothetical protein [Candidatus Eisenbacteria bacterium]
RYSWANYVRPMIGLTAAATEQTVAHEVGHYMNHILTSDDQYLLIENTAPDGHGLGDLHDGRTTIIEDFAYFSQFLLRGSVDLADPTEPGSMYRQIRPAAVDAPSAEGFACVLLARLWSADPTIGDINAPTERRPVPTVNLGMSEILSLISLGATNINELRTDVETYLTGIGRADRLPVILERIGWRYLFKARLVDANGDPLENVIVRKFTKVNGVEYAPLTKLTITDDDGYIAATHAFPGQTTLRLGFQGDSIDVPITVDPLLPTNRTIDLGEITVGNPLDLSLARNATVEFTFYGTITSQGVESSWRTLMTRLTPGQIEGNTFNGTLVESPDPFGWFNNWSVSVTVRPETGAVTDFVVSYHGTKTEYGVDQTSDFSYHGGNVPMTDYSHSPTSVYYEAKVEGTETCGSIGGVTFSYNHVGGSGNLTGHSCDAPGGTAKLKINLFN